MPLKLRHPPILCSAIVAITLLNYASTSETFAERSAGDRARTVAVAIDAGKGRDGLQSPVVKNLHDAAIAEIIARTGARNGDLLFFGADKARIVNDAMGALQTETIEHVFAMRKVLTSDQRKRFDDKIGQALTADAE